MEQIRIDFSSDINQRAPIAVSQKQAAQSPMRITLTREQQSLIHCLLQVSDRVSGCERRMRYTHSCFYNRSRNEKRRLFYQGRFAEIAAAIRLFAPLYQLPWYSGGVDTPFGEIRSPEKARGRLILDTIPKRNQFLPVWLPQIKVERLDRSHQSYLIRGFYDVQSLMQYRERFGRDPTSCKAALSAGKIFVDDEHLKPINALPTLGERGKFLRELIIDENRRIAVERFGWDRDALIEAMREVPLHLRAKVWSIYTLFLRDDESVQEQARKFARDAARDFSMPLYRPAPVHSAQMRK